MQEIPAYDPWDFTLKAIMVFNPLAQPLNPKPSEQEIQDAKLIYYHPANANIDEQRNQVGLTEGFFVFCDAIQPQVETPFPRFQTIHLLEQTYAVAQISSDLYIYFAFSHAAHTKVRNSEEYYSPQCHQVVYGQPTDLYVNVCKNFIAQHQLWYGNFTSNSLNSFIPTWVHCYSRERLNLLIFQHQQFKYAPIDGQLFLTMQYLISMLRQIDSSLTELSIFFQGYYIYSTLPHKCSVLLKDHYYGSGIPWSIYDQKINQKFKHYESNEQDSAFMKFCNLKTFSKWDSVKPQKIFINGEEQNYFTFFDRGLLILLQFKKEQQQFNKLKEIITCILRNSDKIAQKLEQQIDNPKIDTLKYLYYNGMNFAYKVSSQLQFMKLSPENLKIIEGLSQTLQLDSQRSEVYRIGSYWYCGLKTMGRQVIVVLPTTTSMSKLDEELNRSLESTFSSLFL